MDKCSLRIPSRRPGFQIGELVSFDYTGSIEQTAYSAPMSWRIDYGKKGSHKRTTFRISEEGSLKNSELPDMHLVSDNELDWEAFLAFCCRDHVQVIFVNRSVPRS